MDSVDMHYEDKEFHVRYDPSKHGPDDFLAKIKEMKRFTPSVDGAIRAEIEGSPLSVVGQAADGEIARGGSSKVTVTLTPDDGTKVGSKKQPTTVGVEAPEGLSATTKSGRIAETLSKSKEVEVTVKVGKKAKAGWHTVSVKVTAPTSGEEESAKRELTLAVPVRVVEAAKR